MELKELRLGNWYNRGDKECQLEWDDYRDMEVHKDHEGWEPIPLTEEWLKKFEYKEIKTKVKSGAIVKCWDNGWVYDIKESKEKGFWLFRYDCIEISKFKYVHQLQNLYFALTGEELKET